MQNQIQESYCESEFDIYQEYKSNSNNDSNKSENSSNPHEESGEISDDDQYKLQRSKNASQALIRDSETNQVAMDELFKRPSLTMNGDRNDKKKSIHKKKASRFQKQIACWIVNK